MERLDRALTGDVQAALARPALRAFLALEVVAGAVFVARRGIETTSVVLLVWAGFTLLAFFAWWAGRHDAVRPAPDPVSHAGGRLLAAVVGALGLGLWSWGVVPLLGAALAVSGFAVWVLVAARHSSFADLLRPLSRDPRPLVPFVLMLFVPRLLAEGLGFVPRALLALPSGVGQQLLFLVGFFAPLEAVTRRTDLAAVGAALMFAALHVPFNLPANGGDLIAAAANAVFYQGTAGLVACLAFTRHRAPAAIGAAHALAIA